jgi:flavin-binding protein dodecin
MKKLIAPKTKQDITEELIYKYIEIQGTKNKQIQEAIYNSAVKEAKSGDKFEILKKVMEFFDNMKKIKGKK